MDKGELAETNSSGIWHGAPGFFPDFFLGKELAEEKQDLKKISKKNSLLKGKTDLNLFSLYNSWRKRMAMLLLIFSWGGRACCSPGRTSHNNNGVILSPGLPSLHLLADSETRQGDCALWLSPPPPVPSYLITTDTEYNYLIHSDLWKYFILPNVFHSSNEQICKLVMKKLVQPLFISSAVVSSERRVENMRIITRGDFIKEKYFIPIYFTQKYPIWKCMFVRRGSKSLLTVSFV